MPRRSSKCSKLKGLQKLYMVGGKDWELQVLHGVAV